MNVKIRVDVPVCVNSTTLWILAVVVVVVYIGGALALVLACGLFFSK